MADEIKIHPWGFGFVGTPEEIHQKIDSLGEMLGGFNEVKAHLKFLVSLNNVKKMRFHAAGHEGHFVMNLEEFPEEEKKEETKNES